MELFEIYMKLTNKFKRFFPSWKAYWKIKFSIREFQIRGKKITTCIIEWNFEIINGILFNENSKPICTSKFSNNSYTFK